MKKEKKRKIKRKRKKINTAPVKVDEPMPNEAARVYTTYRVI